MSRGASWRMLLALAWSLAGSASFAARPAQAGSSREAARALAARRVRQKYADQIARQHAILSAKHPAPAPGDEMGEAIGLLRQVLAQGTSSGSPADMPGLECLLSTVRSRLPADYHRPPRATGPLALPEPRRAVVPPPTDLSPLPQALLAPTQGQDPIAWLRQTDPALLRKALAALRDPSSADGVTRTALAAALHQKDASGQPTQAARALKRLLANPKEVQRIERLLATPADPPAGDPAGARRARRTPARRTPAAPEPTATPTPRLRLKGVLQTHGGRVALINGKLLRVGQTIHGARVVRIEPDRVTLERDAHRITLTLAPLTTSR